MAEMVGMAEMFYFKEARIWIHLKISLKLGFLKHRMVEMVKDQIKMVKKVKI